MSHLRGRFEKDVHESVRAYTSSIGYDWDLAGVDILGSIAHARMLGKQGIITKQEAAKIISALETIAEEIQQGKFRPSAALEDVHMNIEARLITKIGNLGRKLHTARSRNDQVATDVRLIQRNAIAATIGMLSEFQATLVALAEKNIDVIMPGYTHTQRAQPILFSHHIMAYFEMFSRDVQRFDDCLYRTNFLPLGSGALAGVPYPIDREAVAKELDFDDVSANSIDAVSDRDFILEYEFAASVCMMHLSRLSEELVLWSTQEFDFIELDDAFTTGSSMMPQKKNPDVAELTRGKTGRVYGHLMALLTTMKSLPLAYNRDMQEDKEGLFDTITTLLSTLEVQSEMLKTLRIKPEKMRAAAEHGYLLATDIADYLVKKGEPFRTAHQATGKLVQYAISKNKSFKELTLDEYRQFSALFQQDVFDITIESSIAARDHLGGTAKPQVQKQVERANELLADEDEEDAEEEHRAS